MTQTEVACQFFQNHKTGGILHAGHRVIFCIFFTCCGVPFNIASARNEGMTFLTFALKINQYGFEGTDVCLHFMHMLFFPLLRHIQLIHVGQYVRSKS